MAPTDPRMLTEPQGSSLAELADAAEERFGDAGQLVFEGTTLTSAQLGDRARRVAGGLTTLGVRTGDRVAVCMANCPEVLQAYQAIWRVGAAVTPLLFLLSEDELRHALADSGATVVITTPEFLAKVQAAAAGLTITVVATGPAVDGVTSFAELADADPAALTRVDPGDLAALLYTGGTTGRSKGVMLSHDALSSAAWAGSLARVDEDATVSLLPLPLAHAYGLLVATLALHATRPGRTILMRWFDPAGWARLAQDEGVQVGAVVPTMLRLLIAQPLESFDLSRLQRLTSGSAPLPAEVREEFLRRLPHVEVVEGYGCSETAAVVATTPTGAVRPGSVGCAAPGVDIRIETADGDPAEPGRDGEICVRSPGLMSGYWRDPQTTAHVLRDGWFHTGDVGHVDADGFLFVVDRIKDVIIRDGFNVYPRDVEEAFARHPDVEVCAVVGRPDERHGEEAVAFVQLRADATATPADLVAFGKEHLSAVKYPRDVRVVPAVPLTSIGKLDRKALRAQL